MRSTVVVGVVVAALTARAAADRDYERYKNEQLPREMEKLKSTAPAPGVDKAPLGAPGWCGPLTGSPQTYGFGGHLESYYEAPSSKGYALFGAAEALCKNDPKQPLVHRAAQEILQLWMNSSGLSAPDAVESFKLWLDKDGAEALQQKLCKSLAVDNETGGAERAYQLARRGLFDCSGDRISVTGSSPMSPLAPWLDSSAKEADEIVRLAYVEAEAKAIAKAGESYKQQAMLGYAVAHIDFKAFDPKKALALLDSAPYKGNAYARVVVKQAIGATRINLLAIEAEVKKLGDKDADWKAILVTAPQQGASAWLAAAAKYKAELQRSAEFEQAAFGPSKKAIAGCQEPLKKDVQAVLKTLRHDTPKQLVDDMNQHPIAGLLFRRYQACVAGAGDASAATEMRRIEGIRVVRGPRAAAYYATIDAIGKVRADRTKFAIREHDVGVDRNDILDKLTFELANDNKSSVSGNYSVWTESGIVKTAKKDKDGVKVVFAKDKQQRYIETDCKTTNRIVMFDHDGQPILYRTCKGSVKNVDVSPNPITVPAALADGVAPGKLVSFGVSNSREKRVSMPFEVYADKKGKKLIAWYGIGL